MSLEADLENLDSCLRQLFQTIKRPGYWIRLAAQAGLNIDRPAAAILLLLHSQPQSRWGILDLASRLGVEAPSITRKTKEMEATGLINRIHSPKDRRSVQLSLTPKGRQLTKRILKARQESLKTALKDWPAKDRRQFINYFNRFTIDLANEPIVREGDK